MPYSRVYAPFRGLSVLVALVFASSLWAADPAVTRRVPPAGSPNVVVVLLDDVGFGAAGTFGGAVDVPALDDLAREGLRYNRFHTTAICSPTRAALLTGRNQHATGVGSVMNSATTLPGYNGVLRDDTATIATILSERGYATSAWGKWHLVPDWEATQTGPFTHWPTGQGFDTFYGFLGGETDQYEPTLYSGTTPVVAERPPGYHLSEDLAEQAIAWMRRHHATDPARPFFVYFAPGAAHAPLQPPASWLARYHGRFDRGWDVLREETFARQKTLGVIPENAQLTPRPAALPAWSSLSAAEQRVSARLMELFAAFLGHTDAQVGRLRETLRDIGQEENTLFVYIVGDNGASAEGGLSGSSNYMGSLYGFPSGLARYADNPEDLRGETSYAHYNAAWAWATNSPFQWTKQVASHLGGTRNPMVLAWPSRIRGGGLRAQFAHVNDITPTILEATGTALPAAVRGVAQRPLDGQSLVYTFDNADAPERHTTQYFEIFGNRAIYHNGWMASAFRGRLPWQVIGAPRSEDFAGDSWELYDLRNDYSQSRDLSLQEPGRLRQLQQLFDQEAVRNSVVLHNPSAQNTHFPSLMGERRHFSFDAGMVGLAEKEAPDTRDRSHIVKARIRVPEGGARGVIATLGGRSAGWSLFLDEGGVPTYRLRVFDAQEITLRGDASLAPGTHTVRYAFTTDGPGRMRGGECVLSVDGREVARAVLARSAASFSIDETFDVGLDTGSAPADYRPPFAFTGTLERFEIELP